MSSITIVAIAFVYRGSVNIKYTNSLCLGGRVNVKPDLDNLRPTESYDQLTLGQLTLGQLTLGQLTPGQLTLGQLTLGQLTLSKFTLRQLTLRQLTPGQPV